MPNDKIKDIEPLIEQLEDIAEQDMTEEDIKKANALAAQLIASTKTWDQPKYFKRIL